MTSTDISDYLASDEKLFLSFIAEKVDRDSESEENRMSKSSKYKFGITDRRVIYLGSSGSFKDIDFKHISSIETGSEEDYTGGGGLVVGCCGGIFLIGGIGSISSDPGAALIAVLLGGVLLAIGVKMTQEEEIDTVTKEKIRFITGDEHHQQIEVTLSPDSEGDVGAKISRIMREQR